MKNLIILSTVALTSALSGLAIAGQVPIGTWPPCSYEGGGTSVFCGGLPSKVGCYNCCERQCPAGGSQTSCKQGCDLIWS